MHDTCLSTGIIKKFFLASGVKKGVFKKLSKWSIFQFCRHLYSSKVTLAMHVKFGCIDWRSWIWMLIEHFPVHVLLREWSFSTFSGRWYQLFAWVWRHTEGWWYLNVTCTYVYTGTYKWQADNLVVNLRQISCSGIEAAVIIPMELVLGGGECFCYHIQCSAS